MADIVVQFRGTIYENGYGQIAQKVMRDRHVHAVAKAVYAYLVSFAGQDGSAFPSVQLMMDELGIKSKDTFYKYRNQLIDAGYITVEQQKRVGGQFYNNVYIIELMPCPKKQETVPFPKKSTPVNSTSKVSYTKNLDTTNISSIQKTDINNNHNNNPDVDVVREQIELNLGKSINSLLPLLAQWIEEYGADVLLEKARYVGDQKNKRNIVGMYRKAVTENWDTTSISEHLGKKLRDPRYEAFYELYPEA